MLPFPSFYDPRNAERWDYAPNEPALFEAAIAFRRTHEAPPASADRFEAHLFLIDEQKDFCFPEGSLYVAGRTGRGALDDNRRIAEFIYRNLDSITRVTLTLDSHHPFHIFFPSFWVDRDGAPLRAHREISTEEVRAGAVRPSAALAAWLGGDEEALRRHAIHYCAELEKAGKYKLYLWPPHCIVGSAGHTIAGVVQEARMFHAYVRSAPSSVVIKGEHPLTENYSALSPEVLTRHDGERIGERNAALIDRLLSADMLIVAGQASSHCVKSTVEDLLAQIMARDRALARKVYLLVDCMSAVAVPDGKGGFIADFTSQAEAAQKRFAEAGMHLVRSTELF